MLAEIKDSEPFAVVKEPGTQWIVSPVEVIAADPPLFRFWGLERGKDATITHESAEVTLTLHNPPTGYPEGSHVTFAPLVTVPVQPPTDGPITWRRPGTEEAVARPGYIKMPELRDDATTLAFFLKNTSRPNRDVVIGFNITVLLSVPGSPVQTVSSPDPTIINVDPPDLDVF